MNPSVSVVIAVYNGDKFIAETLESLISQSLTNWECWIVDDGSTDRTIEIVRAYSQKDKRFRFIQTAGSNGPYFAANIAFPSCRGEFIARVDADDICLQDRLAIQSRYLREHPNVNVCGSQCFIKRDHGPLFKYADIPVDMNILRWQMLFHNRLVHSTMMIRRTWFESVGYYPAKDLCQDYFIWCKALIGHSLGICSQRLVVWRQHNNSITASRKDNQFRGAFKIAKWYSALVVGDVNEEYFESLVSDAWGYKIRLEQSLIKTLNHFIELNRIYRQQFGIRGAIRRDFRKRYCLILRRNSAGRRKETVMSLCNLVKFDPRAIFSPDIYSVILKLF